MAKRRAAVLPNDSPAAIARANINREVVSSPTFVTLYSNDTQLQMSPWDLRMIFGEIVVAPTMDHPASLIKQTGEVRMSPQHAKKIAVLLLEQLRHYEEKIGPIPLPSD